MGTGRASWRERAKRETHRDRDTESECTAADSCSGSSASWRVAAGVGLQSTATGWLSHSLCLSTVKSTQHCKTIDSTRPGGEVRGSRDLTRTYVGWLLESLQKIVQKIRGMGGEGPEGRGGGGEGGVNIRDRAQIRKCLFCSKSGQDRGNGWGRGHGPLTGRVGGHRGCPGPALAAHPPCTMRGAIASKAGDRMRRQKPVWAHRTLKFRKLKSAWQAKPSLLRLGEGPSFGPRGWLWWTQGVWQGATPLTHHGTM